MKALEEKIIADGLALGTEVIKVDSFLNQQIDVAFLRQMGREFARLFANEGVTRILTMESSGISIAYATAEAMGDIPVVFAKKSKANTMDSEVYSAQVKSFTRGTVSTAWIAQKFLHANDTVLIIDDFLAHGEAAAGMVSIVEQAGAKLAGLGAVIEKHFQGGGDKLRNSGIRVESLAMVERIDNGNITFCRQ